VAPEQSGPLHACTMDEFKAERSGDAELMGQLQNTIKKCSACGKVCGFSLANCNSCGAVLPKEVTFSANIFMGFVYGVAKAPFPLSISIRRQTPELLVFDDLLSLCPCHLNVIPTSAHIPDWRFLLRRPAEGLALIQTLEDAAWGCVVEQFLTNEAWTTKMLRTGPARTRKQLAAIRPHVIAGMNFPPSQFQLHIQYFLPPFLPFQYRMYLDGQHMTHKRFFPLEYVKAVLALNDPVDVTMDTPIEDLIERFDDRVPYDEVHAACYGRVEASQQLLGNWQAGDFDHVLPKGGTHVGEQPKDAVVAADKGMLQAYGRPYSEAGKPTGTYYKHARSERVPSWVGCKL